MRYKNVNLIVVGIFILWVALNIAYIVPFIGGGIEPVSATHPPSQSGSNNYLNFGNPVVVLYFLYFIYIIWIIAFIIALFRLKWKDWKNLLTYAIMIFSVLIVYITALTLTHLNAFNFPSGSGVSYNFTPTSIEGGISLIVAIILFFVLTTYMIFSRIKMIKRGEESYKNINKKIEKALKILTFGTDVRSAIIKAYYELESFLQSRGVVKDIDYYTAREFELESLNKTKLDREPVEKLIELFEEARYSDHALGEQKRIMAIGFLEEIKRRYESESEVA